MQAPPVDEISLLPVAQKNPGKQPVYVLIYEALLRAIRADSHGTGKCLPIEREIAAYYATGRLTVRQAIELLERNGFVQKRRGLQTLVVRTYPIAVTERPLQKFTDIVQMHGVKETRILSYEQVTHAAAAQVLLRPETEKVYRLRIERFAEHGRIGFGEVYLPLEIGRQLKIEHFQQAAADGVLFIYAIVQKVTGVEPDHTKVSVGATDPLGIGEDTVSRLLPDRPLLRVSYLFTSNGAPIQWTTSWYDASFYTITFDLTA